MKEGKLASLVLVNGKIGAIERLENCEWPFLDESNIGKSAKDVLPSILFEKINLEGNYEGELTINNSKKHLQITKSVIDSTELVNCEISDAIESEKEEDRLSMAE